MSLVVAVTLSFTVILYSPASDASTDCMLNIRLSKVKLYLSDEAGVIRVPLKDHVMSVDVMNGSDEA